MILLIAAALAADSVEPTYNDDWKQGYGQGNADAEALPSGSGALWRRRSPTPTAR